MQASPARLSVIGSIPAVYFIGECPQLLEKERNKTADFVGFCTKLCYNTAD